MENLSHETVMPLMVFLPPAWREVATLAAIYNDQSVQSYLRDTLDFLLEIHSYTSQEYTPEFRNAAGLLIDPDSNELMLLNDYESSIPSTDGHASLVATLLVNQTEWNHIGEVAQSIGISLPYVMQSAIHFRESMQNYDITGYQLWYVNHGLDNDAETRLLPHVSQSEA